MKKILLFGLFLFIGLGLSAQEDKVFETFKDTRVINTHSVEVLKQRQFDFRIGHRFGDLLGDRGGWKTFYGLEQAQDILFGFEYGITDQLTVSISRTKGAGPLKQLLNGGLKYRILHQTESEMPVSLTVLGLGTYSTMQKSSNPDAVNNFSKSAHRLVYGGQVLIARKFSNRFSLQLTPSFIHRNVVPFGDDNNLFSIGLATRIQLTKVFGLLVDATIPFSDLRTSDNGFYAPIGVGLEVDTGGHVFQINFTNATGMMETDYIPYTTSNWGDSEFRLGFTISRIFNL